MSHEGRDHTANCGRSGRKDITANCKMDCPCWCHDSAITKLREVELYAWVGESELFHTSEIGLKQARCPAGLIPMVAVRRDKMQQDYIVKQMHAQAVTYGKTIRLCRFVFSEIVQEVG
jgi:hypothetical protein